VDSLGTVPLNELVDAFITTLGDPLSRAYDWPTAQAILASIPTKTALDLRNRQRRHVPAPPPRLLRTSRRGLSAEIRSPSPKGCVSSGTLPPPRSGAAAADH